VFDLSVLLGGQFVIHRVLHRCISGLDWPIVKGDLIRDWDDFVFRLDESCKFVLFAWISGLTLMAILLWFSALLSSYYQMWNSIPKLAPRMWQASRIDRDAGG